MNRSDLIEAIAARFPQFTVKDADLVVKTILGGMASALVNGNRIELRGFGCFSVYYHPSRHGRNPKTGEAVTVPAKYAPHFTPGKELRERVNAGSDLAIIESTRNDLT